MLSRSGTSRKPLIIGVLLPVVRVRAALLAGYLPRAPNVTEVSFPGNITPITEEYVFARAAGDLKRRYVDTGDRVSAGQLRTETDDPDIDRQVTQAQPALSQAKGPLGRMETTLHKLAATRDDNHVSIDEAYRGSVTRPPSALPAPVR